MERIDFILDFNHSFDKSLFVWIKFHLFWYIFICCSFILFKVVYDNIFTKATLFSKFSVVIKPLMIMWRWLDGCYIYNNVYFIVIIEIYQIKLL